MLFFFVAVVTAIREDHEFAEISAAAAEAFQNIRKSAESQLDSMVEQAILENEDLLELIESLSPSPVHAAAPSPSPAHPVSPLSQFMERLDGLFSPQNVTTEQRRAAIALVSSINTTHATSAVKGFVQTLSDWQVTQLQQLSIELASSDSSRRDSGFASIMPELMDTVKQRLSSVNAFANSQNVPRQLRVIRPTGESRDVVTQLELAEGSGDDTTAPLEPLHTVAVPSPSPVSTPVAENVRDKDSELRKSFVNLLPLVDQFVVFVCGGLPTLTHPSMLDRQAVLAMLSKAVYRDSPIHISADINERAVANILITLGERSVASVQFNPVSFALALLERESMVRVQDSIIDCAMHFPFTNETRQVDTARSLDRSMGSNIGDVRLAVADFTRTLTPAQKNVLQPTRQLVLSAIASHMTGPDGGPSPVLVRAIDTQLRRMASRIPVPEVAAKRGDDDVLPSSDIMSDALVAVMETDGDSDLDHVVPVLTQVLTVAALLPPVESVPVTTDDMLATIIRDKLQLTTLSQDSGLFEVLTVLGSKMVGTAGCNPVKVLLATIPPHEKIDLTKTLVEFVTKSRVEAVSDRQKVAFSQVLSAVGSGPQSQQRAIDVFVETLSPAFQSQIRKFQEDSLASCLADAITSDGMPSQRFVSALSSVCFSPSAPVRKQHAVIALDAQNLISEFSAASSKDQSMGTFMPLVAQSAVYVSYVLPAACRQALDSVPEDSDVSRICRFAIKMSSNDLESVHRTFFGFGTTQTMAAGYNPMWVMAQLFSGNLESVEKILAEFISRNSTSSLTDDQIAVAVKAITLIGVGAEAQQTELNSLTAVLPPSTNKDLEALQESVLRELLLRMVDPNGQPSDILVGLVANRTFDGWKAHKTPSVVATATAAKRRIMDQNLLVEATIQGYLVIQTAGREVFEIVRSQDLQRRLAIPRFGELLPLITHLSYGIFAAPAGVSSEDPLASRWAVISESAKRLPTCGGLCVKNDLLSEAKLAWIAAGEVAGRDSGFNPISLLYSLGKDGIVTGMLENLLTSATKIYPKLGDEQLRFSKEMLASFSKSFKAQDAASMKFFTSMKNETLESIDSAMARAYGAVIAALGIEGTTATNAVPVIKSLLDTLGSIPEPSEVADNLAKLCIRDPSSSTFSNLVQDVIDTTWIATVALPAVTHYHLLESNVDLGQIDNATAGFESVQDALVSISAVGSKARGYDAVSLARQILDASQWNAVISAATDISAHFPILSPSQITEADKIVEALDSMTQQEAIGRLEESLSAAQKQALQQLKTTIFETILAAMTTPFGTPSPKLIEVLHQELTDPQANEFSPPWVIAPPKASPSPMPTVEHAPANVLSPDAPPASRGVQTMLQTAWGEESEDEAEDDGIANGTWRL